MSEKELGQVMQAIIELDKSMKRGFAEVYSELKATNEKMDNGFADIRSELKATNEKMDKGFAECNARIDETNEKMDKGFAECHARIDVTNAYVKELRSETKEGFAELNKRFKRQEKTHDFLYRKIGVQELQLQEHEERLDELSS